MDKTTGGSGDDEQFVKDFLKELEKHRPDPIRNAQITFLVSLIKARNIKKLSQADLAKRLGTQQSVISRIESGRGNPGLRTLLKIAKALEVNLMLE